MALKKQSSRMRASHTRRAAGNPSHADGRRMLDTLLKTLPGLAFRCRQDRRDWTLEFVSDGCLALTGYRPNELIGKGAVTSGLDCVHPNDRPAVRDHVRRALELGRPFQVTCRIRTKSGEEKRVWAHGCGIPGADGSLLAVEGLVTDTAVGSQMALFQLPLGESERRFALAQRVAHFGTWERDLDTDTLLWSDEFFRIIGYEPHAFIPSVAKLLQCIHPDDRQRVQLAIEAALKGGKPYDVQYRIVRPDGSERCVHSQGEAIFDTQGRAIRMFGTLQDTTDQARAEEAVRLSEGRLQEAVRAADAGIFDHDHLSNTVFWSPRQRSIFGVGSEEVVTLPMFLAAVHPDDLDRIQAAVRRAHDPAGDGRFDVEYRILRRDGAVRWLSTQSQTFFASVDGARHPVRTVGATVDVTERKRADSALVESEQRFKMLVKNSPDVIMQVARDGTVLFINYTLPQYTPEAVVGTNAIHYLSKEDGVRYLRVLEEAFATGESRTLEVSAVGPTRWMSRIVPLKRGGTVETAMVIATNITEHKLAEAELATRVRQQAAVAELGQRGLTCRDFMSFLQDAVETVARTLGVDYCDVLQVQPDGKTVLLRAGIGWRDGLVGRAMVSAGPDSQAGYTLSSHEPVIVDSLEKETRFAGASMLREHGVVSGVTVVIPGGKRPYGLLGAHSSSWRRFTQDDCHFLLSVANLVAAALARTRREEQLQEVAQTVTDRYGDAYFRLVVQHVAKALDVEYAIIGRLSETRRELLTLAVYANGTFIDNFVRVLEGTPCGEVATGGCCYYPQDVVKQFPDDHFLAELGISGYVGTSLRDAAGQPVGLLVAVSRSPILNGEEAQALLQIFSAQVSVELQRIHAEREREQSLSLLQATLESTADGILVVDLQADGTIASYNKKFLEMWRIPEPVIATRSRKQALAFIHDQLKDPAQFLARRQDLIDHPDSDSFDLIELKDGTVFERHSFPQRIGGKSVGRVFSFRDITERKRAEDALLESSQFNQQIIANAREGIIIYDRDGRYVVWNPFMEELSGLPAEQVLGKRPTDLSAMYEAARGKLVMERTTMERIEAAVARAMTGETFAYLEIPIVIRGTGEQGWTSARYGPFRNAQGEIVGAIATVWEITERKRAEEQLQQSVSLLQATLESTANGLLVVDTQGKIVSHNRRFLQMWNLPDSLLESRNDNEALDYMAPQMKDPEAFLAKVNALYAQPEAESFDTLEFNDGRVFERYSTPQRIGDKIVGRVWSFHDITPLKLVEQSLTKLSGAVEQTADSIFITNRDGVIEYVNPACEALTGYTRDELVGQSTRLLKSGLHDERFYQALWQTILDGRTFQAIFINRKKSGDLYYEEKIITPIKDATGEITHFVSAGRDITERRRAEEVQSRLAAIIEATTDLVGTVTADGSYLYLNQAGRAMLGFAALEPVAGLHISACHTQEASALILNEAIPRAIKQGVWSGESVLLSRNGKEIPVSQVILAHKAPDGSVEYLSMIARDVSERKAQTAALEYQANHDALTALPNRNLLNDRLRQAILAAQRDHHSLALLVLDLDRFKEINDTLGHHYGDLLLKEVGPRLRAALRESDTVARLGGDEFAVLLPTADQEGAVMTAQKILQALTRPFTLDELALDVEASIGIALFPDHGLDAETILRRADVAMYMAKQAGSGYALYASEHDQYSHRRLALMGELRHAIERQQLFLHYQPTVLLRTGQVTGVEALLRWKHPKYGLVPPDQFIPLAEQTGLIKPLTEMVINAALDQCRAWLREGIPLSVSVNLSARSLHDPTFADYIDKRLLAYGIAPRLLELEITESAIMADPDRAMEILSSLSIMGVRLSIDDFGVGHSSLTYLKKLPVHEIKIDKSFVLNMAEDPDDVMIVRSIIDLGHNQSLKVVAEGVQSQQTLDQLLDLGCDAVQGYFVSRPIPPDELTRWVNSSPWTIVRV
ncbi:MAG TPA: PAS domain S-box protein [Nitrospiria bacterium]|nr:PAS domain S-box protein [Nitrospiria bacterium]